MLRRVSKRIHKHRHTIIDCLPLGDDIALVMLFVDGTTSRSDVRKIFPKPIIVALPSISSF